MSALTPARRRALELVAQGLIVGFWPSGLGKMRWRHTNHVPNHLVAAPYEWLRSERLIRVLPAERMKSKVVITDRGRKALSQ